MSQSYFITGGGAGAISATITAAGGAKTRLTMKKMSKNKGMQAKMMNQFGGMF